MRYLNNMDLLIISAVHKTIFLKTDDNTIEIL